jgi:putative nucleotidyltransferase with HDIG domain
MDVKGIMRREAQLNLIAYIIILSLVTCIGILLFVLLSGTNATSMLPLTDSVVRTLIVGFLLATILYLADQHRRLRRSLLQAHEELEDTRHQVEDAYDRLSFAHHASEMIASLAQTDGLAVVLAESIEHFGADAAAVVGDDVTFTARSDVDEDAARDRVLAVALEAVRAGKPLSVSPPGERGTAIAVPLRVCGKLQAVACLWREHGAFQDDQLDGLSLLGRIIELSMENRMLLDETNAQLEGTIEALGSLVEDIRPDYTRHALAVGNLSALIGRQLGQSGPQQRDLRVAGMLHDVGMLRIGKVGSPMEPLTPADMVRIKCHPAKGADLARVASFSPNVQNAIRAHHEHLDGSGYPTGLTGAAIPLAGRILAVTEAYDSMTRKSYNGHGVEPEAALRELRSQMGARYDARVVEALVAVLRAQGAIRPSQAAEDGITAALDSASATVAAFAPRTTPAPFPPTEGPMAVPPLVGRSAVS